MEKWIDQLKRWGIFGAIVALLYVGWDVMSGGEALPELPLGDDGPALSDEKAWWPAGGTGEIVEHGYFALSYREDAEQAEWVAYELSRERLNRPNVPRSNDFRPDPKVSSGSATPDDYRGSGYDRGHLAPAADMAFDATAMSESFFMSNMSPQERRFNGGIWRELEEQVRDWATANRHLYVVTGPLLPKGKRFKRIGGNEVAVPDKYYKVLLDLTEPELKAIAYVMPNTSSNEPLDAYAVTVDEVEAITGLDFFPQLDAQQARELESRVDPGRWIFDEERFRRRVSEWNRR